MEFILTSVKSLKGLNGIELYKKFVILNNNQDAILFFLIAFVGYSFKFLLLSTIFEYFNPTPKSEKRVSNIQKEAYYSIIVMAFSVGYTTFWLYLIDPLLWTHNYYLNREYGIKDLLLNIIVYMLFMDTWFYWTHRLGHVSWFFKNIHGFHHQFYKPTAFAQDASHPIEAIVQGPFAHCLTSVIIPFHPLTLILLGFFTSCYAIAAHDSSYFDFNHHSKHHTHLKVNFGLYWGLWDWICDTRFNDKMIEDPKVKDYE